MSNDLLVFWFISATTYTLSHPEDDCDVTERAKGYTLQDAQSRDSFLNMWENKHVMRVIIGISSSGIRADITVVLKERQSV